VIYLSGSDVAGAADAGLGIIVQPGSYGLPVVRRYARWAADNGCFGKRFNVERWKAWLRSLEPARENCLFAVAPDVVANAVRTQARADRWLRFIRHLGFPAALAAQDGLESALFECNCGAHERYGRWLRRGRDRAVEGVVVCWECGQPASHDVDMSGAELRVTTTLPPGFEEWLDPDGETVRVEASAGGYLTPRRTMAADVPTWTYRCRSCMAAAGWEDPLTCRCDWWGDFDALFIGGTTAWKLGGDAAWLVRQARLREKWVHMGRVNSLTRLLRADRIGCDSVDGTYLAFGPRVNLARVTAWLPELERARAQMELPL
jgi:hypothetical protein